MPRQKPTHRVCIQPDDESKFTIEVGAMWAHSKGGGFSILLKRGIAISSLPGSRIVAFEITDDEQSEGHERDDRRDRARRDGGTGR